MMLRLTLVAASAALLLGLAPAYAQPTEAQIEARTAAANAAALAADAQHKTQFQETNSESAPVYPALISGQNR